MEFLTIGEVARQAEVGIETIRYYEREGLLLAPARRPSGYRQYQMSAVARLRFIRRLKELGFTLAEIKELLNLWFDATTRCVHVRERAARKLVDIDERIASLQQMRQALAEIVSQCEQRDSLTDCPLWSGLDHFPTEPRADSSAEELRRKT